MERLRFDDGMVASPPAVLIPAGTMYLLVLPGHRLGDPGAAVLTDQDGVNFRREEVSIFTAPDGSTWARRDGYWQSGGDTYKPRLNAETRWYRLGGGA